MYFFVPGFVISNSIRKSAVGGEHISAFLASLLLDRPDTAAELTQLRDREQLEVVRKIKERSAFVSSSFMSATEKYSVGGEDDTSSGGGGDHEDDEWGGSEGSGTDAAAAAAAAAAVSSGARGSSKASKRVHPDIAVRFRYRSSGGRTVDVTVGSERFRCAELLFDPALFSATKQADSVVHSIVTSMAEMDETVRADVGRVIVIGGGSAGISGLVERLQDELPDMLAVLGACVRVRVSCCC